MMNNQFRKSASKPSKKKQLPEIRKSKGKVQIHDSISDGGLGKSGMNRPHDIEVQEYPSRPVNLLNNYEAMGPTTMPKVMFSDDPAVGENVKVAIRIRPMLPFELNRGDDYCTKRPDANNIQLKFK
jgi:hypothetical protein